MPVGGLRNREWNQHTSGINGLPDVFNIDPSRDLLNQDGRKTLGSQGFVDTQEVNLSHLDLIASDNCIDRDARDEAKESVLGSASDTEKPFFLVARGSQCPL
jgi:hypothetical protein